MHFTNVPCLNHKWDSQPYFSLCKGAKSAKPVWNCIKFILMNFSLQRCIPHHHHHLIRYYVVFSRLSDRQDEEMDYLNLFIDYHYKSIVSIIWARHILTLHLSHANWRKLKLSHYWQLQEHSCTLCNFYQVESDHTFSSCNPLSMEDEETLILLYH